MSVTSWWFRWMSEPSSPSPRLRAAGARAERVVGAVHDVVGEQLRTAVEELGERLLAVVDVELVVLLDGNPRKLAPLRGDVRVPLRVLALERRELVACRLPLLTGSDRVLGHLVSFGRIYR